MIISGIDSLRCSLARYPVFTDMQSIFFITISFLSMVCGVVVTGGYFENNNSRKHPVYINKTSPLEEGSCCFAEILVVGAVGIEPTTNRL